MPTLLITCNSLKFRSAFALLVNTVLLKKNVAHIV